MQQTCDALRHKIVHGKMLTRILHTHSWVLSDLCRLNDQMLKHFFGSTFSWWPASEHFVALLDASEFRPRAWQFDGPCWTFGWSRMTMKTLQDPHGESSSYSVGRFDGENLKCQKDNNHLNFHFYCIYFFDRYLWFFVFRVLIF